ncbi:MAG: DMT family transporter [bacterium]|nr:DMT family transporter [bacterium]
MWIFVGIISGLFDALKDMPGKKALKDASPYLFLFAYSAFSLPFLLIAIPWLGIAPVNSTFWWATIAGSLTNVVAMILYAKALQGGELSLTVPLMAFVPVFMLLTSRIMLGESPGFLGVIGIILVVAGAYTLRLNRENGVLGPFKNLARDKSALFMLGVAVIGSINSNWDAIAVRNSSPLTYLIFFQIINLAAIVPLIYFRSRGKFNEVKTRWKLLFLVGLFAAFSLFASMSNLTLTMVPYANALKRTGILFSIIIGFIVFKERKNIQPKLLGAVIMIAGVLFIAATANE